MTNIFQLRGFSLIKYLIAGFVIALVLAIHPGNAQASSLDIEDCIKALPPGYTEPLFSGLGNHKYPNLTKELKSEKAKDYFNQGMTLLYAFNHPEAIHSFNQAAKYEPEAAMPYWGIAMAAGPDINTDSTYACLNLAYNAVNLAKRKAGKDESKLEYKIANALFSRYKPLIENLVPVTAKSDAEPTGECVDAKEKEGAKMCVYAKAYAKTMKNLYEDPLLQKDDDVATLYAAALMNISPWQWWTSDKPSPEILEALKVLSKILEYDSNKNEALSKLLNYDSKNNQALECKPKENEVLEHESDYIGANHYFIHATEESPCPEVALPSANRIAELAPAAGHIQHMPSHVYQRIGKYAKATEANYKALYVDRAYIHQTPETARYPLHYLSHNLHFLTDSLSIQGRESEALAAAQQLFENTKKYSVDDYNPLHNQTLVQAKDDYFFTVPIWTAVRFNAWDFLSKIEHKENLFELFTNRNLPFTETMWTYAQALKYLATTRHVTREDALAKLEEFWEEVAQALPKLESGYGNNKASDLFRIANLVLVARTLEALPSNESESNNFIEKVKNRLENYPVLNKDSEYFDGHTCNERIIKIWERAVCLEDGLNYNEPPDWYYPLRESLGAAYFRQQNYEEAAKVFCKDLKIDKDKCENLKPMDATQDLKIPKMNGRSLFGLIRSLEEWENQNLKGLNSGNVPTPKTKFCENPKGVIEKLCEKFEEAWKNATVEPSLETM